MNSNLFRLNGRDFIVALTNAVFAAIIIVLYGVVTTSGFDLFTVDWVTIGKTVINSIFIVFISSLGAALGIDKNGKVLGSI